MIADHLGWALVGALSLLLVAVFAGEVRGGPLDPPGPPGSTDSVRLPGTPITTLPFTITTRGNYYVTRDLAGTATRPGITINSSNVTLDLGGFTLFGLGAASGTLDGVSITTTVRQNLTIRNGTISGWGGDGINAQGIGQEVLIEDLHVSDNGGDGIVVSSGANVHDCTVADNGGSGILVGQRSVIQDCTSFNNTSRGIVVGDYSTVESCVANGNGLHGIEAGPATVIRACTATQNGASGMVVGLTVSVLDSIAYFNAHDGIIGGALIRGNSVRANGGDGIEVATEALVTGNVARANGTAVADGTGIHVTGASNHIEDNETVSGDIGINVDQLGNTIIGNTARGNTVMNFDVVAGNAFGPVVTNVNIAGNTNPHANYTP
jgi:hypothetical protein